MPVCFSIGVEGAGVTKERQGYTAERTTRVEHSEGDGEGWAQERCVKGKELQNATITRDLCSRARPKNLQMRSQLFLARPSLPSALSLSLSRALRCSCCNAVAVGRKPQRKETSRIALRARARSFVPPKFIRGDASVPPRKLRSCRRAVRVVVAGEKPKESRRPRSNKSRRGTDNR